MGDKTLYFAVYRNGRHYSSSSFEDVAKDEKDVWFFVKRETIIEYNYGIHYNFTILNSKNRPSTFSVGNYEVLKFSTGGTRNCFKLTINFKDRTSGCLDIHSIDAYECNDEITSVIEFVRSVDDCGSYCAYMIKEENRKLKREIERLRNSK